MPDPATTPAWGGILVKAAAAVGGFIKFLLWAYAKLKKRKKHEAFSAPTETLRLGSNPKGACWWHMGKKGDEPIMQIVGGLFATNIASVPARIFQVELQYGFLGRKRTAGMVFVSRSWRASMYGMYDIPPGETRSVRFDFGVYPPVEKPENPFTARAIVLIDQFGNRHKLKRVSFRSMAADHAPKPKEPEEFPYEIADPIEKEIVSVLKAELGRYQMCGRTVGGLGSVHITYKGRAFTGVGNDSWTPNSPLNQVVADDPEAAALNSDNMDALVAFHQRLATDDERAHFLQVMLDRLDAKKGYLSIAYFIVAVLWRIGSLPEALQKARRDLPTGESTVYGLSNVLMLLNGLLKYRHPDFTNNMLDEIERMIHGLEEHPFRIPTKIAAIRANRLRSERN